jgi:hypothetical protein
MSTLPCFNIFFFFSLLAVLLFFSFVNKSIPDQNYLIEGEKASKQKIKLEKLPGNSKKNR